MFVNRKKRTIKKVSLFLDTLNAQANEIVLRKAMKVKVPNA